MAFGKIGYGALAILFVAGCAHSDRKLDDKVSQESAVQRREDLHSETKQEFKSARLTPEQRAKLSELRKSVRAQEKDIWQNTLKLRAVLVKDLLSEKYNPVEVKQIKRRMWDLENKRLTLIYRAIDDANKVLGHFTAEDHSMIDEFFENRE